MDGFPFTDLCRAVSGRVGAVAVWPLLVRTGCPRVWSLQQKSGQPELTFGGGGEATMTERSVEASTAIYDTEHSGLNAVNFRTAVCGPACTVVWEGNDRITGHPISRLRLFQQSTCLLAFGGAAGSRRPQVGRIIARRASSAPTTNTSVAT